MADLPPQCLHCRYDLTGVPWDSRGRLCPECGRTTPLGPRPAIWSVRHPFAFDALLIGLGPFVANAAVAAALALPKVLGSGREGAIFGWSAGAVAVLIGLAVVWGSRTRRRATSRGWLIWHSAVVLIGIPLAFFAMISVLAIGLMAGNC